MAASRPKDPPQLCRLGALALVLPFVLTACGAEPGTAVTSPTKQTSPSTVDSRPAAPDAGNAGAAFHIAGIAFEFSPTICLVDQGDIVVLGPGRNTRTGEIAFLDVDFTTFEGRVVGGADIELGTDRPLTSPDDFYRLDTAFDDADFAISVEGRSFTAEGNFRAHGAAPLPDGGAAPGVLQVRCAGA